MKTISITYDDTVPSMNRMSRASHWEYTRAKKRWTAIFEGCLLEAVHRPTPFKGKVTATAELTFPTRHRRDLDNYWLTGKALGDALVKSSYIFDDTPEFYEMKTLRFNPIRGRSRTTVTLEVSQ